MSQVREKGQQGAGVAGKADVTTQPGGLAWLLAGGFVSVRLVGQVGRGVLVRFLRGRSWSPFADVAAPDPTETGFAGSGQRQKAGATSLRCATGQSRMNAIGNATRTGAGG